jgi:hypothetical protein
VAAATGVGGPVRLLRVAAFAPYDVAVCLLKRVQFYLGLS